MKDTTLAALQQKHPQPQLDAIIPLPPVDLSHAISVVEGKVARAILSFPNGSAGGPDGLKPQHLKDMISASALGGKSSFVEGSHFPH